MPKIAGYILLIVTTGMPLFGFTQSSTIEAVRQKIYNSKTDEERLSNLTAIGKLRNSLHGDTIYHYAQWAKKLALQLGNKKAFAWAEYNLINADLAKGKIDSTVEKIDANLSFKNIKQTDTALYYKIQLLKANALNRLNRRPEALDLQIKILNEAEKEGNSNAQLFALNFIGATYLNVKKASLARDTWLQGLKLIKEINSPSNAEIEAYILSNLALYHFNTYYVNRSKASLDSFFNYINRTIDLSSQNEYLGVLASALALRGNFYGITKHFAEGEKDIKTGLEVRSKIDDPFYIVNDLIGLSNFYLSQKQYKKCIETAEEGITIANNHGIKGEDLFLYKLIGMAYKAQGNYEQYSKTLEKRFLVADSSYQTNSADKIEDIQIKYEVQKKETLIAKQKLDLLQRNLLLYGAGVLAIVLAILFVYRFKRYQRKQKIITEQKRKQNEVAIKEAEENERKRIAAELHDNLGVQANAILHNSTLLNNSTTEDKSILIDLQDTAKEMLVNLRETLWAMKTSDVSATDLWLRIINFMKQMGRHYTSFNFRVEGEVPKDFVISSSKALNIVLVLQESVNNAVKHAHANTITAASLKNDDGWVISIKDDGKGFDINTAKGKTDSYGLQNMQERAISGSFIYNIDSAPGIGTKTIICITGL